MIIFIPKEILTSSNPFRLSISSPHAWIFGYTVIRNCFWTRLTKLWVRACAEKLGEERVASDPSWDWQRSHVKVGKKLIVVKCSVARGETLFPFAKNTVEIQISVAGIPLIEKVKMETWRASYLYISSILLRFWESRGIAFRIFVE